LIFNLWALKKECTSNTALGVGFDEREIACLWALKKASVGFEESFSSLKRDFDSVQQGLF
jgi:hypothetical protein